MTELLFRSCSKCILLIFLLLDDKVLNIADVPLQILFSGPGSRSRRGGLIKRATPEAGGVEAPQGSSLQLSREL